MVKRLWLLALSSKFYTLSYLKMIIGSGIDIVEIVRIQRAMDKWEEGFLTKVFTEREIFYSQSKKFSSQHFAARFAAKEAVIKALGNGEPGPSSKRNEKNYCLQSKVVRWRDIEILNDDAGKPEVKLNGYYRYLQKERKIGGVLLSMSHAKEYALASVVLVSNEK